MYVCSMVYGVTKFVPRQNLRTDVAINIIFFKQVGMNEGYAESKKKVEKGVKKRCEIVKKGVKLLIWRNF